MTKAETIIDVPHDPEPTPGTWRLSGMLISIVCPQCWTRIIFVDPNRVSKQCVSVECGCSFSRVCRLGKPPMKGGTES